MARFIDIQYNEQGARNLIRDLKAAGRQGPRIISRALNKVAAGARTIITRRIGKELPVKQTTLRNKNVKLSKSHPQRLAARIHVSGKRIPLGAMGPRQTTKGVTYRLRKGGPRKLIKGGFLVTLKNKKKRTGEVVTHLGVFVRREAKKHNTRKYSSTKRMGGERIQDTGTPRDPSKPGYRKGRLPMRESFGISVPVAMESIQELSDRILGEKIAGRLEKEITTQMTLVLNRGA